MRVASSPRIGTGCGCSAMGVRFQASKPGSMSIPHWITPLSSSRTLTLRRPGMLPGWCERASPVLLHTVLSHLRKCRSPSIACPPNTVLQTTKA